MKNIGFGVLLIFMSLNTLSAQKIKITDENFEQKLIALGHDQQLDGSIPLEAIKEIKKLNISHANIKSLKGIEYFTALEELNCSNNSIKKLKLPRTGNLKKLNCSHNDIKNINFKGLNNLVTLRCNFNKITNLNISKLDKLQLLSAKDNFLQSIDISNNKALVSIKIKGNQIKELKNLINNPNLEISDIMFHQLFTVAE